MKRFICFLVTALLMLNTAAVPALAEDTEDERIAVIAQMGLMQGDDSGDFRLQDNITRAEMVTILYRIMYGEDVPEASGQIFDDVDKNNWAAGYVERMYEIGIIEGDGESFRPKDNVSAAECYTMFLRVAGYGSYLASHGTYPTNAITTAADVKLSKGIKAEADDALIREQVAILLYNLLDIEVMTATPKGTGFSYSKGGKFMNEVMDIYSDTGVIDGIDGVKLDGEAISKDDISINGVSYASGVELTFDDLGLYGEFYYREENGSDTVIGFFPKHNETLELRSEDIVGYDKGVYECYIDGKTKRVNTYSGKDVIINRTAVMNDDNMCPDYGTVKMIDNDRDGRYDVVIIEDYQNILCSGISEAEEVIYYDTDKGRSEIHLTDFSEYKIFDLAGNELDLRSIGQNKLLMLQYRDDNTIYITVCSEVITGTVTKIEIDEFDRKVFVTDDGKYTVADSNDGSPDKVTIGTGITAYLDLFGNIGAIAGKTTASGWQYGFVIKSIPDETMEDIDIRLLNQSGAIETLRCSPKIIVDGQSESNDEILNKVVYGSLIRYIQNSEGSIVRVDTPYDKSSYTHSWDDNESHGSNDTWLRRANGKMQYKSSSHALRRYTAMDLDGQIFIDNDTVVFSVPDGDTFTEEDEYGVGSISSIGNDTQYKIAAFNDTPDSVTAQVLIMYKEINNITSASRLLLVQKLIEAVDDDGDETYIIKGLYGPGERQFTLKSSLSAETETGRMMKRGDVLRITLEGDVITSYEFLYTEDGLGRLNSADYVGQSNYWDATFRYTVGAIEYSKDGKIIFRMNAAGSQPEFYDVSLFKIYVYDKSAPDSRMVMIGSPGDIRDKEFYPDSYDTVILGTASSNGRELILIRQ